MDITLLGLVHMKNGTDNCTDGIQWVFKYFTECVTTQEHFAAFIIGFVSLLLWLIPLFPQIYENYKRGSCEDSMSIYFLCFWIAGDTTNFVGAILTQQLPTQIYIGAYYILQDFVLLGQYCYYVYKNRWRRGLEKDLGPVDSPTVLGCVLVAGLTGYVCLGSYQFEHSVGGLVGAGVGGIRARFVVRDTYSDAASSGVLRGAASPTGRKLLRQFFHSATDELGYALGTLSAIFYLSGRIPQIMKNMKRADTEGLSTAMFIIIICGNLTYGLSVLLAGEGNDYILRHLPWLVGSIGCCSCDSVVLGQIFYYDARKRKAGVAKKQVDEEPLLGALGYMGDDIEE